jgi:hypothetical protein
MFLNKIILLRCTRECLLFVLESQECEKAIILIFHSVNYYHY